MFMAILNDTYSEVKEDVENRKEDFQVIFIIVMLGLKPMSKATKSISQ